MSKAKKYKIKSRKDRLEDYEIKYKGVSTDIQTRLEEFLGNDLTPEFLEEYKNRRKKIKDEMTYSRIDLTLYEFPMQSHRPRFRNKKSSYVPCARENFDYITYLVEDIKDTIKLIATPTLFICNAYYKMPANISKLEAVLYEFENSYAVTSPDFDNVLKAYTDMIQKQIILNDDLVSSCSFNKYYSLLPRVEISIIYQDAHSTKHAYKTIKSRKSFKDLEDHIDMSLI